MSAADPPTTTVRRVNRIIAPGYAVSGRYDRWIRTIPFTVRPFPLIALALLLCVSTSAFAQDDTSPDDQAPPPGGPVLQPSDFTPTVCDPGQTGFRYDEVDRK